MTIREKLGAMPPSDIEFLNILIYGESAIGKTTLIGSAAEHEFFMPMLVVDIEGGTTTIRKRKDIDVVRAKTIKDVQVIQNELYKDTSGHYRTVAIDSLTELQDLDLRAIMKQAADANANVNIDVPSPREWGITRNHIRQVVRAYRDLPMNTLMTALVLEEKEEGRPTKLYPSLPGKMRGEIAGFMDIVGYYYKERKGSGFVRRMQFTSTTKVLAKDRTGELGDSVDDPTLPMLMNKIFMEET